VGLARHALLRALAEPDGNLALKVLERTVPQLAPLERVANQGAISRLDFSVMTDEQLSRISKGEHPYVVLAQTRAVLGGPSAGHGEILQLPRGREDGSEA